MGNNSKKLSIIIHDGREEPVELERMIVFEKNAYERFYEPSREYNTTRQIEKLGPVLIDFTNIHSWAKDIPDIDPRSARLFSVWFEEAKTHEIIGIAHGFFLLLPFILSSATPHEYHSFQRNVPYYPIAIIYSVRTTIRNERYLDLFLDRLREGISSNWKKTRTNVINRLPKGSDLWKRYVLSFENIIHFTFLCPSIDREIIDALERNDYRITSVLQLLASPTPSHDEATITHHLHTAREILKEVNTSKNQK
ncbi:MAG: hypothetical protein JSW11_09070 [Candidatus Heimdallarchaeota archaeon]|nr:MAG: hypothetical protein JSW11_09070 [Candidatus Heimdallarchaeota archaeon]